MFGAAPMSVRDELLEIQLSPGSLSHFGDVGSVEEQYKHSPARVCDDLLL